MRIFQRSSIKPFIQRLKRITRMQVVIAVPVAFALLIMATCLTFSVGAKQVTLVVHGQEKTVYTKHSNMSKFLDEQAVQIGLHDRVIGPVNGKLRNGSRVEVEQANLVRLTVDGQSKMIYTFANTVQEMLRETGIQTDEDDVVWPHLQAEVVQGSAIQITTMTRVVEQSESKIAYGVVHKQDPTLLKGQQKVIQPGRDGVMVEHYEKVYEGGQLLEINMIGSEVVQAAVDQIVAVGTKKPEVAVLSVNSPVVREITKLGITFGVKQVLNGVKLTAYDAGPKSTGKNKDHPQYGVTFTGTKVKEGRTIAVDPKVIPLGWWVYIEGVGFRRAEDKGSAVKGKKVDIYVDDVKEATRFGTKKGATVYVIGPNKPE